MATLQVIYLLLHFHFSYSLRISPDTGLYVTRENRGAPFRFHCEDAEGPIVWKRNGIKLVEIGDCLITPDIQICKNVVHVSKFRNEFAGEYTCEDTKESTSVDLGVAPEFSRPGSTEVVFRSTKEQLNLSCEVRQYVYPKASVKWYKRLATGTVNVHVGDTMLNSEIDVGDVTIYICEAKNYPNGVTRRKTFFVRTYEPANCTVLPTDVAISPRESVYVNVTLTGNPSPKYSLVAPWKEVRPESMSLRAVASVNSSGNYKILHVIQIVSLRGRSREFPSVCSVHISITGKNNLGLLECGRWRNTSCLGPHSPEVCLLMQQHFNESSCSTKTLTQKAGKLSRELLRHLQTAPGIECYFNVTFHYIVSRGRSDCTSMRIGASVSLSSQHDCLTIPSLQVVNNTIETWIHDQLGLRITKLSVGSQNKIFCTMCHAGIPHQQNVHCDKPVHFRCSKNNGITRFCTLCKTSGSNCGKFKAKGPKIDVLNSLCSR